MSKEDFVDDEDYAAAKAAPVQKDRITPMKSGERYSAEQLYAATARQDWRSAGAVGEAKGSQDIGTREVYLPQKIILGDKSSHPLHQIIQVV